MERTKIRAKTSILFTLWTLILSPAHADTTIDSTNKYAWAANAGWVNFEGDVTHGVITAESILSGYAWAANIGWINLGDGSPANGYHYANDSSSDFGINHDGEGNLYGYAWSANTGWLNFGTEGSTDPNRAKVNLLTGNISGYVWSANLGWVNLGTGTLMTTSLDCPDTDSDGIGDAWEMKHFGSLATVGEKTDHDNDGQRDPEEHMANTDPDDPNSRFEIVDYTFGVSIGKMSVRFTSSPSRLYRIYYADDLNANPWSNSPLGLFAPSASDTTSKTFSIPLATESFFRVEAIKPLQP